MNNIIEFYTKNVYGNETDYILSEKIAFAVQRISKQKSLTYEVRQGLKLLGFEFKEVIAPRKDK